jgi:2-polyprenyl-6-methoxyphenol hydroxylase-like FAD-dependent oxidoreductase
VPALTETERLSSDRNPILIIGGGLGGLTTALALARRGIPSRVLEGAPEFGAIGYGVQFGPNVFHVFDRIGVTDADTGAKRARVIMKAGDVAAMPADIRHQGYSSKRSMLLVWENGSPRVPEMIAKGEAPVHPVEF